MKQFLFFLSTSLCLFFSHSVLAQNPLNRAEMLPYGSVFDLSLAVGAGPIDTTIQGPNAVWDFSNLQKNTSAADLIINIVDPALTPNGSSFPTANYAYEEGPDVAYRYFNLNDSVMERLGSFSATRGLNTYSDPQIEYVFPLDIGTQNVDSWASTSSTFGGTYKISCVGQGQLKIPGATYDDALMVYVEIEELFSYPVYFWYSADNGAILLQYVVGDGFFLATSVRYLNSISIATGIEDEAFISSLRYQNPVLDLLDVSLETDRLMQLGYYLTNTHGQVLKRGELTTAPSNTHDLKVDTQPFAQGLYYLTLYNRENPKEFRTLKLMKE